MDSSFEPQSFEFLLIHIDALVKTFSLFKAQTDASPHPFGPARKYLNLKELTEGHCQEWRLINV